MIRLKLIAVFIFAFSLSAFAHQNNRVCNQNQIKCEFDPDSKPFSVPLPLVEKMD